MATQVVQDLSILSANKHAFGVSQLPLAQMKIDLLEAAARPTPRLPPCLIPTSAKPLASSNESSTVAFNTISTPISGRWNSIESWFKGQGVALPAVLKAAWALTLQCYVSSEVICFEYHGLGREHHKFNGHGAHDGVWCTNGVDETPDSMLCLFRMDESENVLSFFQRMTNGRSTSVAFVPTRDEIIFASPIPSSRTWNTSITYHNASQENLNSSHQSTTVSVTINKSSTGRFSTNISYPPELIGRDLASSILSTFNYILTDMLTEPQLSIREIETCSPHDRKFIQDFTQKVALLENSLVHDLIVKQCRATPGRTAVCSWEGDLTYGELDDLSCRLAHHLISLGVSTETYVFSCFEKSMWAVVARLAVLRAGGAYVSIHALSPPGYLDAVVMRTKSKLLITTPKFEEQFRPYVENVLAITPEFIYSLPRYDTGPATLVQPDNACLVLFTSGSTGEPKGIIQTHQSYTTSILNYAENLGLGPHTRFLHFDDYSFDISNLEFMTPLLIGGCCCVPRSTKTLQDIVEGINALKPNISFLTPTVAIKLNPALVPSLDILCVGGEPMSSDLITKWTASRTKLINQYGMGEVAVCCAYNDNVSPDRCDSIGRPASGAIWIVDPVSPDRLMPVGAVGELLMEGHHLSRRYLDQISRRSEAVFVDKVPGWMHDLHPDRVSARLYRSGDLGRLLHDGTIQYIGRKDTMLKLDGCRVEALEVEYHIRKCLGPNDSVVVDLLGVIDGVANPILSAYVYLHDHPCSISPILKGEPILSNAEEDVFALPRIQEIKRSISNMLPVHMVPKNWVLANWIPRTPSNKTDRKKLHMVGQKMFMQTRERDADASN
ncbi:hypothetical protein B0I35DRAFT_475815 [Stachybotrys elegans]|uniref:AMP-dependent synthetase/ligase domain-containing protein n=1 Tax=Stachybotrys elegans TaxID=80388 RepID=A0A8K0T1U1_9HYPO|nr:hypothetical protein B0I35DRAFT_475815 [Stachybotrys elegans]